jgi:hypothetical protein
MTFQVRVHSPMSFSHDAAAILRTMDYFAEISSARHQGAARFGNLQVLSWRTV